MCPDFPQIGGATAAQIWAYATRNLNSDANNAVRDAILSDGQKIPGANVDAAISSRATNDGVWGSASRTITALTGTPRSDLLGEDATFEAGTGARKAKIDNLDAAITTRSSHAAADIWAVATRQITALTGTPRSDLFGEDATFEAGTGARKARLDKIPAFETPVEASVVMDGTEKILVEKTDDKQGILEGYVDLTPMVAGNIIVIRQWMKVKTAGNYVKYAEETYSGEQTIPLLYIVTKAAKTSVKVTAQQTDVTYKTLDVQFYRRPTA